MADTPFTALSYVGGPALLTNATALIILSTTNRFARAVDRSRVVAAALSGGKAGAMTALFVQESAEVRRRLIYIARAMTGFYLASATFGLATLAALAGAILSEFLTGATVLGVMVLAGAAGAVGFISSVHAFVLLVLESRIAVHSVLRESDSGVAAARARGD